MKKLKAREVIITAYAQHAHGPGWANRPLWVIIRGQDGTIREECIQPEDQTAETHTLFNVSASIHNSLVEVIQKTYSN